jgi:hypothetical protein
MCGDDLRLAHHQVRKPSRRIISMRMASCNSPRPITLNVSWPVFHADRDVGEQFLVEAVAQIARRDKLALRPGERRRVDGERHRDGRLVDVDRRQGAGSRRW